MQCAFSKAMSPSPIPAPHYLLGKGRNSRCRHVAFSVRCGQVRGKFLLLGFWPKIPFSGCHAMA